MLQVIETTPYRQDWTSPGRMDPEDRNDRIEWIRGLIRVSLRGVPDRCPLCDSRHVVRYGKTGRGTPRFRCRGCGRTFVNQSLLSGSRVREDQWMRFAECYVDKESLDRTSRICGTSRSTVRRMREKLDLLVADSLAVEMDADCVRAPVFGNSYSIAMNAL